MVDFANAENEQEFIESIRSIFLAYVPESDAWAKPNFFDINATVIGGLAWSAVNEARNGFDARVNLQTAQGEYLDLIAATPPLNIVRRDATVASGFASVTGWPTASIPAGAIFETAQGTKFTTDAAVAVLPGSPAIVALTSVAAGLVNNSQIGQPLINGAAVVRSLGIYGGFDVETDEQLRNRIYAEKTRYAFFGSACSYERMVLGVPGVSRGWAIQDGGISSLVFLMEGKYPCGVPQPQDIADVQDYFADPCLTAVSGPICISGACSKSIDLVIDWGVAPDDVCAIEAAMTNWLRNNYDLGEGVRGCDIDAWLQSAYPEFAPKIDCGEDFSAVPCCVYNCVELTPNCE